MCINIIRGHFTPFMDEYGLLGYPLGHSFSRTYFSEKFAKEGINAEYVNHEIPNIEDVRAILETHHNLKGLNVTIPYKEQILPYLDEIDPEAKAIGAVNVIKVTRENGKVHLKGFNSDVIGFKNSIRPLLKDCHTQALVLGTGGASRAVRYGLTQLGLSYRMVSRRKTAENLSYADITPELLQDFKVVINCTPCGMYPKVDECPAIPYEALQAQHLLYDLTYNPETTLFMKKGAAMGAATKNGWEMLVIQAEAAWRFWNE